MAQPAESGTPLELPVRDVRTRLLPLARMTALTGTVTLVTDAGRPLAALVPVDAARSRAAARAARAHQQATAEGWQRRLETMRGHLRSQHQQQVTALQQALTEAWQLIAETTPPGSDRHTDTLRAQHRALLGPAR